MEELTNEVKTPTDMVREFIETFGQQTNPPEFWLKLVEEEYREVKEAAQHLLKETIDLQYVLCAYRQSGGSEDVVDMYFDLLDDAYDKICDHINQLEAFKRVHASNMSKLDDLGKPMYRGDGKVLKGPNYVPPDFSDLI